MRKLSDLVANRSDGDVVQLDGVSLPVKALKNLMAEGYENIRVFPDTKTISTWGKNCTACFTEAMIKEMAK